MKIAVDPLSRAIEIAAIAHEDQWDKAGQPYILHPLRVMLSFSERALQIIAVLHDVAEDSALTLDDLGHVYGYSSDIIAALNCLTHRKNESYTEYIDRVATNPLAVEVKLADLKDNMDMSRLKDIPITQKDIDRFSKYLQAQNRLLAIRKSFQEA